MSGDYKRLYRSRDECMISGVCGGLGQYFNVDPTLIRLLFVLFAFAGVGSGVLAYIVMVIVVPEEPVGGYVAPPSSAGEPQATVEVKQVEVTEAE